MKAKIIPLANGMWKLTVKDNQHVRHSAAECLTAFGDFYASYYDPKKITIDLIEKGKK